MDTRLYISKDIYKNQTVTREIDFTQSPYVLTPNGQHTDVTVGDWHYGAVNYDNTSPLYGWQPEASQIGDTQLQTTYWDLGINEPTALEVRLEITNSAPEDGVIEIGFGNEFRQVTNSGTVNLSFSPITSDPYGVYGYKLVFRASGGTYIPSVPTTLYIHSIKVKYTANIYDPQYQEVDLYDDIDIPITYNVGDVRDISKKDANWSLTIRMPNTQNNAQLFELNNDISRYNSTFEMLKQYPAFVEVGCNRTFAGYFKLTKVIINDNKEVSYEGNLYSNVIEFMVRLGTTTLRGNADPADDLSFSEYTTVLDADTLYDKTDMFVWDTSTTPWTAVGEKPYGRGWYCAIVDKYNFNAAKYSRQLVQYPSPIGIKTVYPLYYDELTPYLFYKEIWDKIFRWAGYNYVSGFIDGTNNPTTFDFSHLAYPDLQWESALDNTYTKVIQDNNVGIANSSVQCYWHQNSSLIYPTDECNGYVDCYANTSGDLTIDEVGANVSSFGTFFRETINKGGIYTLNLSIPFDVWIHITDQSGNYDLSSTDTVIVDDTVEYEVRIQLVLRRGGVDTAIAEKRIVQNYESSYNVIGGICKILEDTFTESKTLYLMNGDELFFKYYYIFPCGGLKNTGGFVNYNWVAHLQDPSPGIDGLRVGIRNYIQFLMSDQDSIQYELQLVDDFEIGSEYDPTVILDPKESKVDFITNIIKKFNLYIEDVTDKKDENGVYYRDYPNIRQSEPILRIEPRNAYYDNNSTVRDWTTKTDVSTIEFERIDNYIYKLIDLNDDNDKTYYTEDYANYLYIEGEFGEKKIKSPFNTSADEKTEIKTKLGQTMVDKYRGECTFRQVPKIFTFNDIITGEIKTDKHYDSRMLFVNNINGTDWLDLGSEDELIGLFFRDHSGIDWIDPDNTDVNRSPFFSYILLSHFNNPFGKDTADLNFGRANWYYQNLLGTQPTDNNAYYVFYKQMIDDYNSPEARLMRCKMYLKSSDIRDLQLSDTIIVNNVAYHINKIKQWKSEYEPVEVELIKIIQSTSKFKQPILKNRPPKIEIVTLNTLKELIESQNKTISEISKQVENLDGTIKKMDEQLIKLDERVKKLEGGSETSEDGSNPDKDEEQKDEYD